MKPEVKKRLSRRLKIIEGQVRGLQKMIEKDKYCIDVITQSSAIRNSLGSFEDVVLEKHLSTCTINQIKSDRSKKAIEEILGVYKLAKKK
ncbi:hypothetical protein CL655_02805 [bacterium]|nr:hypothetical protein [bacterium]